MISMDSAACRDCDKFALGDVAAGIANLVESKRDAGIQVLAFPKSNSRPVCWL